MLNAQSTMTVISGRRTTWSLGNIELGKHGSGATIELGQNVSLAVLLSWLYVAPAGRERGGGGGLCNNRAGDGSIEPGQQ